MQVPSSYKTQGFTLIELLIVVALIGLLASVMIPNLLRARAKANDSSAASFSRQVATTAAAVQINGFSFPSCSYTAPDTTIWSGTETATVRAGGIITDVTCAQNPVRPNALDVTVTYGGGTQGSVTTTIE